MRRQYTDFQTAGAEVVGVGMGTPAQTRAFIAAQQLPFPLLSDPQRHIYRAYGAIRGTLYRVAFHPQVLVHGARAVAAGHTQGRTVGDPMQLSATFIVDPAGVIRFAHRADVSSAYASPDTLLTALATLPAASLGQPL